MSWCKQFKQLADEKSIFLDGKTWYGDFEHTIIEIKYCPFCGATLTSEDI